MSHARKPYKSTLFDRHGPEAGEMLRALGYGVMVFGLVAGALTTQFGLRWWVVLSALGTGAAAGGLGWLLGNATGWAWKRMTVDGASTPYKEQYSYQQSLVMQGRIDDALESFEAVIAEKPDDITPRIKAAELYAREKQDHRRAAELFRAVQRIPGVGRGEDIYASNRLVDLYTGPLNDVGRALVELRRLAERYPGSPAAVHARAALAALKQRG